MLFSVLLDDFEIDHVHYTKNKKNIIMNGLFTKILYSDSDIVMNGLYINFTANIKYVHNKSYYVLDKTKNNQEVMQKLIHMENDILLYYKKLLHQTHVKSIYLIKSQLDKGILKYIPYDSKMHCTDAIFPATIQFILKISGIWQNEYSVGLNYKIVSLSLRNK